jgi:hypothetical protein
VRRMVEGTLKRAVEVTLKRAVEVTLKRAVEVTLRRAVEVANGWAKGTAERFLAHLLPRSQAFLLLHRLPPPPVANSILPPEQMPGSSKHSPQLSAPG